MKDIIKSYFEKRSEVIAVYLFGSHAKGKNRQYSDIDLGILIKNDELKNEEELHRTYLLELTGLLRMDFHIVLMHNAGEGLLFQIFKYGECLVNNALDELTKFKMVQYSMIADFGYYRNMMQKSFVENYAEETP